MIPNMKFYVISIVAIFAALGIGIYIGFTIDAQSIIVEQKEDIASKIEERFDFLTNENQHLKSSLKDVESEKDMYKHFIDSTYEEIVKTKLEGINVAIIETKSDYMYSGVGQILETAGANVINVTTITDKIVDEELLKNIYEELGISLSDNNIIPNSIMELSKSIINGEETELVSKLIEKDFIDMVGLVNEPIDYIVLAGGSLKEDKGRLNLVDKVIIDTVKIMDKSIIAIEKENINISYIEDYKKFRISTVDNVNTSIGKVSLILAMEGRPGHYGVKPTAEELTPRSSLPALEYPKER
ncbi:copper transporter [Schnuerera sp.]|uniref:copper transporter n=1 Tax=Schnuerera sp. TaxID=2794844 RepID=UPI002B96307D|nr:copper transporter [Schnuerera sp.]HSH34645.1 copper transporter [Schnuerera sp.]